MNGPHDVGGMHGFGTIVAERNEPPFHEDWEGRVHGMNLALAAIGQHTVDEFRHAIERIPRADYYAASYYEKWLYALERLLVEKGIATPEELAARAAQAADAPERRPDAPRSELADDIHSALTTTRASDPPEADGPPRFAPGDAVRARNLHTKQHLRLPGYAKHRTGEVLAHRGAFLHPLELAHGGERRAVHLYTVGFPAAELWGAAAERADDTITIDLFEDYLEPA
jgi:nitrile hydratase subunit beta